MHYQRWRISDEGRRLTKRHVRGSESERFWAQVEKTDNCWNWTGALMGHGYGHFQRDDGRDVRVHRWAYAHLVGPIPDGLWVDHTCHNRRCVNPKHLRPITARGNCLNRIAANPRSKTGRRGVWLNKSGSFRAVARFEKGGPYRTLGVFQDIEEAAWLADRVQEELIEMECA